MRLDSATNRSFLLRLVRFIGGRSYRHLGESVRCRARSQAKLKSRPEYSMRLSVLPRCKTLPHVQLSNAHCAILQLNNAMDPCGRILDLNFSKIMSDLSSAPDTRTANQQFWLKADQKALLSSSRRARLLDILWTTHHVSPRRAPTRIISNGQSFSTRRSMALRATLSAQWQLSAKFQLSSLHPPQRAPMAELSYSNIIACPQPREPLASTILLSIRTLLQI
ncbi:hypothetical protein KCU87_g132, partial [Aureobasidium melanogenum]